MCPSCGYCPHCGRHNAAPHYYYLQYPYGTYPTGPIWYTTTGAPTINGNNWQTTTVTAGLGNAAPVLMGAQNYGQ